MDEIGKMECLSARFLKAVRGMLNRRSPILATIAAEGGGLIAEVKRGSDSILWEVTVANRDKLSAQVLSWLVREKKV